jgi:hypothetical protein
MYRINGFNNWDIEKALQHLNKLIEIALGREDILKRGRVILIHYCNCMAFRLLCVKKNEKAYYYIQKTKEFNIYNQSLWFFNKYSENDNCEREKNSIEDLFKTGRIIYYTKPTHPKITENLFKYGLLSEKRYKKALLRFKKRDENERKHMARLTDFIKKHGFSELPYDRAKPSFKNRKNKSKHIPPPRESITDIGMLSDEQMAEYFIAFSSNTSTYLVRKYMLIRAGSLVNSILMAANKDIFYGCVCHESNLLENNVSKGNVIKNKNSPVHLIFNLVYIRSAYGWNFIVDNPLDILQKKYVNKLLQIAIRECEFMKSIQVSDSRIGKRVFEDVTEKMEVLYSKHNK